MQGRFLLLVCSVAGHAVPLRARSLFAALSLAGVMATALGAETLPESFSLRYYLHFAATEGTRPYLDALLQLQGKGRSPEQPLIEYGPARPAAQRFCSGLGADYPDVLFIPRRISHGEFRRCQQQGVADLLEFHLGYEVLVLAVNKQVRPFSLGPEQLYRAMALMVPDAGSFQENRIFRWRDIDARLPDIPIRIAVPKGQHGIREFVDDQILQAGCRGVEEIRAIYSARERLEKCLKLRTDGAVLEIAPGDMPAFLDREALGAIAIMPFHLYEAAGRRLGALPFAGFLPTRPSIQSGDYPLSRQLRLYAKVAHIDNRRGYGVAAGLQDFVRDLTGDQIMEPGGMLERLGLVLPPLSERARQRRDGLLLRPMVR
jgi:phosphate transport system substrate-binding protein